MGVFMSLIMDTPLSVMMPNDARRCATPLSIAACPDVPMAMPDARPSCQNEAARSGGGLHDDVVAQLAAALRDGYPELTVDGRLKSGGGPALHVREAPDVLLYGSKAGCGVFHAYDVETADSISSACGAIWKRHAERAALFVLVVPFELVFDLGLGCAHVLAYRRLASGAFVFG
jgi:hypothetical protein